MNETQKKKYNYNRKKDADSADFSKRITTKKELFRYIESNPGTTEVLCVYKEPKLMAYFFPKLKIDEDDLKFAQDLVRMQIYADVLKKVKDVSVLDRIENAVQSKVMINFNVLPKARKSDLEDKNQCKLI
jgi:hypothetical protein